MSYPKTITFSYFTSLDFTNLITKYNDKLIVLTGIKIPNTKIIDSQLKSIALLYHNNIIIITHSEEFTILYTLDKDVKKLLNVKSSIQLYSKCYSICSFNKIYNPGIAIACKDGIHTIDIPNMSNITTLSNTILNCKSLTTSTSLDLLAIELEKIHYYNGNEWIDYNNVTSSNYTCGIYSQTHKKWIIGNENGEIIIYDTNLQNYNILNTNLNSIKMMCELYNIGILISDRFNIKLLDKNMNLIDIIYNGDEIYDITTDFKNRVIIIDKNGKIHVGNVITIEKFKKIISTKYNVDLSYGHGIVLY